MKMLLVHIANLAVMFHMTFGCSWHHGLGFGQGCTHSMAVCSGDNHGEPTSCSDHDHDGHSRDLPASPATPACDEAGSEHSHDHFGCQDDGCNVTKVTKFVFAPADYWIPYLDGVVNSATARSLIHLGDAFDPLPDCSYMANSVRLHLLLGVQLL